MTKKTTRFVALGAAALLMLSACGSDADDAATDTDAATSVTTPAADDATDADADGDTDGAADADSDADADTDADADAAVPPAGDIDADTAAWFTTFCTGMAPLAEMDSAMNVAELEAASPAEQQAALVGFLKQLSTSLTDTAAALQGMPVPNVSQGAELAAAVTDGIGTAAPSIAEAADTLAAVDPSDPEQLEQSMGLASLSILGVLMALDTSQFEGDGDLLGTAAQIPACAPLGALGETVGGFGDN